MKRFDEAGFSNFVLNSNPFRFNVILASGRKSVYKLELSELLGHRSSLDYLIESVISKTMDLGLNPNTFMGVPQGCSALGALTQYHWSELTFNDCIAVSRVGEGYVMKPAGKTVLLEDVVTTAGSVLKELDKAYREQVEIIGVIALIDRMQNEKPVREILENRGIIYDYLADAPGLLVKAYQRGLFNDEIAQKIEQEYSHLQEGWLVKK